MRFLKKLPKLLNSATIRLTSLNYKMKKKKKKKKKETLVFDGAHTVHNSGMQTNLDCEI